MLAQDGGCFDLLLAIWALSQFVFLRIFHGVLFPLSYLGAHDARQLALAAGKAKSRALALASAR